MMQMHWFCRDCSRRCGSALIALAVILFASLAVASYAINVAYMQYTRTELQIATDVATRAACRALVDTGNQASALVAAQQLAGLNKVAGRMMQLSAADLEFAAATRLQEAQRFSYASAPNPNSVRMSANFFQRSRESLPMLFPTMGAKTNFRPFKEAIATQAELDLAIVLDCSSSMMAPLYSPSLPEGLIQLPLPAPPGSRWRVAESGIAQALATFPESPQNERVALTTFNTASLLNVPLTNAYAALQTSIAVQGQAYLGGRSSLGDGLRSAVTHLSNLLTARPWACRVILLISDGNDNFGPGALAVASDARAANIMIYTISLGIDANRELLQSLSSMTYGRHMHANSAGDVVDMCRDINRRLPILISR